MYLSSLKAASDTQAALCAQGGGIPQFWYPWLTASGSPDESRKQYQGCNYPPSMIPANSGSNAPPANITVTVPTTTTVSPQVSPQFIQQDQPSNSPIDATVSQEPPEWLVNLTEALKATPSSTPAVASPSNEFGPVAPMPMELEENKAINPWAIAAGVGLLAMAFFSKG